MALRQATQIYRATLRRVGYIVPKSAVFLVIINLEMKAKWAKK